MINEVTDDFDFQRTENASIKHSWEDPESPQKDENLDDDDEDRDSLLMNSEYNGAREHLGKFSKEKLLEPGYIRKQTHFEKIDGPYSMMKKDSRKMMRAKCPTKELTSGLGTVH